MTATSLLPGTRCHEAPSAKCVSEGQRHLGLSLDHLRPHLLSSSRHLLLLCHVISCSSATAIARRFSAWACAIRLSASA